MRHLSALLTGALFSAGLAVAGMTQPNRVLAFLDVTGAWNPSLVLVMGGAIVVFAGAYRWTARMSRPVLAARFARPSAGRVHMRLVLGAMLFGSGWGLAGYCPGPALASLGAGHMQAALFVAAMVAGIGLVQWLDHARMTRSARM